jgi:1-hydroxycarotenoid 3,4-desaturase
MLVAHVEREGVWLVEGGMHRIAEALAMLAARSGVTLRFRSEVREIIVEGGRVAGVMLAGEERIEADAVLVNADAVTLSGGRFGSAFREVAPSIARAERSLSAITWTMVAPVRGFPLERHNVFFSGDYADEFARIRGGKLPAEPTVYICAQDRPDATIKTTNNATAKPERLLCLVNAPANGDSEAADTLEIKQCEERTFAFLERCDLQIERSSRDTVVTTPRDFEYLYPGTGGALYGPASHGWMASFRRPSSRTPMEGLYLAGGSTHPGPGVPMAAISGGLAAEAIIADFASMRRSQKVVMHGGTSMR